MIEAVCQRQTLVESTGGGNDAAVPDLREKIAMHINERKLLVRRQKVLVGVSGGLDSMVLLHLLAEISPTTRWKLGVVHLNHALRGRASGEDARFVSRQAERLGLPVFSVRKDVAEIAAAGGGSLEMAARDARHGTFVEVARKWRCRSVALAHHLDDQLELFFLRLFRGAGSQGLGGMRGLSPSPMNERLSLVRPLLNFSRTELADYATVNRIRYREDESNSDEGILRNRVRHRLIPMLTKEFQPALPDVMARSMEILREESAFLESQLDFAGDFELQSLAVKRALVRRRLIDLGVAPAFELIERLLANPGQSVNGPKGLGLCLEPGGDIATCELPPVGFLSDEHYFEIVGKTTEGSFAGMNYTVLRRTKSPPRAPSNSPVKSEFFDADAVGRIVRLRHWRPGDRFQPIGMNQSVKLQNLFVNAKISRNVRRKRVLAETSGGIIFWVEGLRIGEIAKVRSSTRRTLEWTWERVR
jgi:tRNA(Ile)-lysidine synthase